MQREKDFAWCPEHLPHSKKNMASHAVLRIDDDLLLCNECGTQYPVNAEAGKKDCRVCDVSRSSPSDIASQAHIIDRIPGSMFLQQARRSPRWRR